MKILADLHVHSIASGHSYSTIEELAKAAAKKRMELIAIADHGPAMPGGPHKYFFGNLRVLPEVIEDVKVLRGVEANILDAQGTLDLEEYYLQRLDIVLAGLHSPCLKPMSKDDNTQAMVNALKNPYVDIIVHPGNPEFAIDIPTVVAAASDYGKALEINNSSFLVRKGSYEPCLEIAKQIRQHNTMVSLGSDAHFSQSVGELKKAIALAAEAGIPTENIINLSAKSVEAFLAKRGKQRFQ